MLTFENYFKVKLELFSEILSFCPLRSVGQNGSRSTLKITFETGQVENAVHHCQLLCQLVHCF